MKAQVQQVLQYFISGVMFVHSSLQRLPGTRSQLALQGLGP